MRSHCGFIHRPPAYPPESRRIYPPEPESGFLHSPISSFNLFYVGEFRSTYGRRVFLTQSGSILNTDGLLFSDFDLFWVVRMGSELIFRGHEAPNVGDAYSPKPTKPWFYVTRSIRYMLREQRLVFVFVGIAIATLFLAAVPSSKPQVAATRDAYISSELTQFEPRRSAYQNGHLTTGFGINSVGKIPLGLKGKGLRIVVTGGAGFVGSHLVDRLIGRGDSVIVVDNFFTGRKQNLLHHFGNPRFELIRHDVVEPLLLEVDQIYHLACPASPVHYKHNPVKTIISFSSFAKFLSNLRSQRIATYLF